MAEKNPKSIIPGGGGFFGELSVRAKLIIRLIRDKRVNFLLKLLPFGALAYVFIPDLPGPIDDAAVIWLGTYLFVELCPPNVVQEHLNDLHRVIPGKFTENPPVEIVDGEFTDAVEPEKHEESGEFKEEK
ncbi:MAG: hypothetical protein AB9891_11825 [Anaerolineaceae bacterium]